MSRTNLVLQEARLLEDQFEELYGQKPRVYCAPGRVNLIGEHTDYNDGFVMPVAMDMYTWVAAAPRDDSRLHVYSKNLSQHAEMDLQDVHPHGQGHWSAYVLGVAASLRLAGTKDSRRQLIGGRQSSDGCRPFFSASLEVATGYALLAASGLSLDPVELAKICQRAENEFAGARCGIMDQMIACCGRANYALMLDCRTLEFHLLPLFHDAQFVVCNSMVKHDHAAGEYNARRADCETATRYLSVEILACARCEMSRSWTSNILRNLCRKWLVPPQPPRRERKCASDRRAQRIRTRRSGTFWPLDARIASQPAR